MIIAISSKDGTPLPLSESLVVEKEEKTEVGILATALFGIVNTGVNNMDLLETFLTRRIQPLQARAHPMWLYEGPNDPTRVHPEDVDEETVEQWFRCITGARDNPLGLRRIPPFDDSHQPTEV